QDLVFEIHQTAAFEAQLEQLPRTVQKVETCHRPEGVARPAHRIAGFEQGLIKAPAVVGHQHVESREMSVQRMENRRLLVVIAHKELANAEALRIDAAHSDEKRAGTGAARESGGLGVEKRPSGGMSVWD